MGDAAGSDPALLLVVGAAALALVVLGLCAFLVAVWRDRRRRRAAEHRAHIRHESEVEEQAGRHRERPPGDSRWP
jgi:hypothetical protein